MTESLEDVYGYNWDYTDFLKQFSKLVVGLSFVGFGISILSGATPVLYSLLDVEFEYVIRFSVVISSFSALLLFSGIMSLLPLTDNFQRYWFIGNSLSVIGILVFTLQYPGSWSIYEFDTILLTGVLYISGLSLLISQIVFSINSLFAGSVRKQIKSDSLESKVDLTQDSSTESVSTEEATQKTGSSVGFIGDVDVEELKDSD